MNFVLYGEEKFLLDKKLNSLKKKYRINDGPVTIMLEK